MQNIRTLLISFDVGSHKVPLTAFRGAIVEKVGRNHSIFHNHSEGSGFIYQYPLIQYKTLKGKPSMFCFGIGVDEIHKLFEKQDWKVNLLGKPLDLKVDELSLKTHSFLLNGQNYHYTISRWQGLNSANFEKYNALESLIDRIALLEKILTGNLLSMAKGIGWHVDKPIHVKIQNLHAVKPNKFKDIEVITFNLQFFTNVNLPPFIGLGKGASTGFGIVEPLAKSSQIKLENL